MSDCPSNNRMTDKGFKIQQTSVANWPANEIKGNLPLANYRVINTLKISLAWK